MRWDSERYVKVYRRDTAEWLVLSWQARGLFYELLRRADRDGCIAVGRLEAVQAVAILVRGTQQDVAGPLTELIRDGCIIDVRASGNRTRHLLIRNYREAQGENETSAERMRRLREKKRAAESQANSPQVTGCDESDERDSPSRAEPSEPSDPFPPVGGDGGQEETAKPRPKRTGRIGVGHPAFEAVEHWRAKVWPRLSTEECPEIVTQQSQSLAGLSGKHGPAAVRAAMDAAVSDGYWGPKLDLDTFISKFPKWLGRRSAPASGPSPRRVVGVDENGQPIFEDAA